MFFLTGIKTLIALCLIILTTPLVTGAPHTELTSSQALVDRSTEIPASKAILSPYIPPDSYTGDVLNATKCYCADPTPQGANETWGHFWKIDYFNWHTGHLYSIILTCNSNDLNKDLDTPVCWAKKGYNADKEGERVRFADGNEFGYTYGVYGGGILPDFEQLDHYSFNKQTRAFPKPGPGTLVLAPDACNGFCRDRVGGMVVAKDDDSPDEKVVKSWVPRKGPKITLESTFTSYTDTDDMCRGCK